MRTQIHSKNLVPIFGAGRGQAASESDADIEHKSVDSLGLAPGFGHDSFTVFFAAHVGDDYGSRTVLARDQVTSGVRWRLVLVYADYLRAFSSAQQSDGASIANWRIRFFAGLRARADHDNSRALQSSAARRGAARFRGRPHSCAVAHYTRGGRFGAVSHNCRPNLTRRSEFDHCLVLYPHSESQPAQRPRQALDNRGFMAKKNLLPWGRRSNEEIRKAFTAAESQAYQRPRRHSSTARELGLSRAPESRPSPESPRPSGPGCSSSG